MFINYSGTSIIVSSISCGSNCTCLVKLNPCSQFDVLLVLKWTFLTGHSTWYVVKHDLVWNKLRTEAVVYNYTTVYTPDEHEWTWVESKIKIWEMFEKTVLNRDVRWKNLIWFNHMELRTLEMLPVCGFLFHVFKENKKVNLRFLLYTLSERIILLLMRTMARFCKLHTVCESYPF